MLDDQGRPVGFWAELKRNLYEIKEAFKIREYYLIILYLFIGGFLVPNFGSFGYYFMLDVVGISKFTYSMLTVLGYICLLIGTQFFNKYFKESEYRNFFVFDDGCCCRIWTSHDFGKYYFKTCPDCGVAPVTSKDGRNLIC